MSKAFYSARLLFIILVDDGKPKKRNRYDETVVVFAARDFDHAFERALEIGHLKERSYVNVSGQNVRWALVEILNLDLVGSKVDGMEVASKLHTRLSANTISARMLFHPERSKPGQSF